MTPEIWTPGAEVARVRSKPLDRTALALYAGASGDHNPIHIDLDAAREAGLGDVIGHGMFAMALLSRALTEAVDQRAIRSFGTRFLHPIQVGDVLECVATVVSLEDVDGDPVATVSLTASTLTGEPRLAGQALVSLGNGMKI